MFLLMIMLVFTARAHENVFLASPTNPFSYDLGIRTIASADNNEQITLCCHGYGHNSTIVDAVHSYNVLPGNLVGFNFPDHDIRLTVDHTTSKFGTPEEILPLLYLLKYYACDLNICILNLYGFSAGGGAIVNALAILNKGLHEKLLTEIGIFPEHVSTIITALERGTIILDCPLKSVEEVLVFRGNNRELEIMAAHYAASNMTPLEVLPLLNDLTLTILLHFQNPDEILSNRDDELFIERLKAANKGTTHVVVSSDGGHNAYHKGLWDYYKHAKS